MKFRLEKVDCCLTLPKIPIGHVAGYRGHSGVVYPNVLRVDSGAVNMNSWVFFPLTTSHHDDRSYIDLGPIGAVQEKPKRVPFAEIPVGHVGKTGSAYWLRANSGGVQLLSGLYLPIHDFEESYEDLGKLVVEDDDEQA